MNRRATSIVYGGTLALTPTIPIAFCSSTV